MDNAQMFERMMKLEKTHEDHRVVCRENFEKLTQELEMRTNQLAGAVVAQRIKEGIQNFFIFALVCHLFYTLFLK